MKKFLPKAIIIISIFAVLAILATGCSTSEPAPSDDANVSIVTTGFPEYDWTKAMLEGIEGGYDLTMLLGDGIDMHSYQPSAKDIVTISEADMFVYGGGESDEWIEDVLAESTNDKLETVSLMDVSEDNAVEEEEVEGMQEGREEEADEPEYDEHVWMSPRIAKQCCRKIADKLIVLLPEDREQIEANYDRYANKLDEIDAEIAEAVSEGDIDTIVCCDRFPFRYLMDDYGLKYYAAFPGCSTEADASFETILFLAGKVDELGVQAVVLDASGDESLAKTVIENTESKNAEILRLNSMQIVTKEEADSGMSYLGIMADNAEVIRRVLSRI